MQSQAYTLSKDDLKRIGMNVLIFNVPTTLISYLTAYSQDLGMSQSLILASINFLTAFMDFARKLTAGSDYDDPIDDLEN